MTTRLSWIVVAMLVLGSTAFAGNKKPAPRPSVVARVIGLEVVEDAAIVTIAAGSEQGIGKTWRAKFREGNTEKPLAGGEAVVIRIDRRTSVLKARLTAEQVRTNKRVQLDP